MVLARRLQATIRDELGLPCSIGVATNKLLAKTATEVGKATGRKSRPDYDGPPMPSWRCRRARRPPSWRRCPPTCSGAWDPRPPSGWPPWASAPSATSPAARRRRWPAALRQVAAATSAAPPRGIDDSAVHTEREEKSVSHETTFERGRRRRREPCAAPCCASPRAWAAGCAAPAPAASPCRSSCAGPTSPPSAGRPRWTCPPTRTPRSRHGRQALRGGLAGRAGRCGCWAWGSAGCGQPVRQLACGTRGRSASGSLQEALDELREKYGRKAVRRASELK